MAKAASIGTATARYKPIKRTKSERSRPGRAKRKAYRGQGRVR